MSLCLRTLPNKLTSFVNTRKQVTKIDRHLLKHVTSSLLFKEFLGTQTAAYTRMNCKEKSLNPTIHSVHQHLFANYMDTCVKWPKTLNKTCDWNQEQTLLLQQQRQTNTRTLDACNINVGNNFVLDSTKWSEPYINSKYLHRNKKSCIFNTKMLSVSRTIDNDLFNPEKQRILYTELSPNKQNVNEKASPKDRKPSEAQLQHVFDTLSKELPALFIKTMTYEMYTQDIIFINNIRGTSTTGIINYVKQIAFLKILGHIKFAYVKFDILKITMHPEDSSVKVRWRIIGITGTHVFLQFWRVKIWRMKQHIRDQNSWYDGFSTFYVNNDGKIFKHVVDKMMPDQEYTKPSIEAKLALFASLLNLDSYNFSKLCSKMKFRVSQIK
ncbi:uncharacterized protein LOC122398470 [Colletes gigas]|uniref:uncharacterized protein LOC122398470 n=1 Tax=Colletes gigas TaxID=935657 RepID=UPI001C9B8953|nr:uncharacterized protein LOC122398470 [Colletes gigas]